MCRHKRSEALIGLAMQTTIIPQITEESMLQLNWRACTFVMSKTPEKVEKAKHLCA